MPLLDAQLDHMRDVHASDRDAARTLSEVADSVRNFSVRDQAQELRRRGAANNIDGAAWALKATPSREEARLCYRIAQLEAERNV